MPFDSTGLRPLQKFLSFALWSTPEYAWIDGWACSELNHLKTSPFFFFSSLPLVFVAVLVAFPYH